MAELPQVLAGEENELECLWVRWRSGYYQGALQFEENNRGLEADRR